MTSPPMPGRTPSPTPARQTEIYLAGARGVRPRVPVDAERLQQAAQRAMSREAFAHTAGGARAAASLGVPMVFSNQASIPMEKCAAAMGAAPRWFQIYWSRDDELVGSLVHRAERCGCDAIVVTLDTTLLGWRTRDLELGHLPFLLGKGIAQ